MDELKKYSTCDISDALLKLGHPRGGFIPGISMWSPKRQEGSTKIVGPAYTVKFVLKSQKDAPALQNHYIDTIPSGTVIFISAPAGVSNAVYGGLMTHRAQYQGALGTVVDGNFRDMEDQRKQNYPVFARGVSTPAFYEVARPSEVNVPVTPQDSETPVHPGDTIIADLNGVVCIPKDMVTKVTELVAQLAEDDANVETDLDNGAKFSEATKKHRR